MQYKTKLQLRRAANSLSGAIIGAWILASYVRFFHPGESPFVENFQKVGFLIWLASRILGSSPSRWKPSPPTPQRSAWGLCLATGFAAAFFLLKDYRSMSDLILPAAILLLAITSAFVFGRLAQMHAAEIGEARFRPDGKPLGPWKPPA